MQTLTHIFLRPWYLVLALVVAWIVVTIAVMVPNWMLIWFGLSVDGVGARDGVAFLLSLYGSLVTNFTPLSASVTVLMSLLFGLNVALLVFYIRMMRGSGAVVRTVKTLSVTGLVSGFFGIGCAVCGSVILTSLLGLFGATSLLIFLPLHGEEFSFLALGLLGYSLVVLLRRIKAGKVCLV